MFKSPLLLRVVAIILPVALGVLVLMAAVAAAWDWQDRRSQHLARAEATVDAALGALSRDLWQLDVESLRANLANLAGRGGIRGAVVTSQGDYITVVGEGDVPEALMGDPDGWSPQGGDIAVASRNLAPPQGASAGGETIGTVTYLVETLSFREVFSDLLARNMVVFGAAGLITLATVLAIVWRRVIKPVEIIRASVVNLRAGRYVAVPWHAQDEIGDLAADMTKLVTQLEEGERAHQAWHQSYYYFPVTGLPNRNYLIERINALIESGAGGGDRRVLLHLIDIDRFHLVNEAFGEATGDRVLVEVAQRLQAELPAGALLAHIGTDQFAVLANATRTASALAAAQAWPPVFRAPLVLADREIYLRAAVGVAELAGHENAEMFLRDADLAMHQAKQAGGDQACAFDPQSRSDAVALLKTDSALQTALAQGHIKPYYQPIVDLAQRRIAGFEVLARWEDPDHGLIRPDQFIPVAEKTGTITAMAEQLLHQALADQRERFAGHRDVALSVNLAPQQMLDAKFLKHLRGVLEQEAARQLYFEITESTMMREWAAVTRGIESLAEGGATLLLDDFGTGESSLAELHALPFDGLKIDKAFLRTAHEKADWSFVATIIALARATNLRTVAEGIEEEAHIAELTGLGCGLGQGFYFAKPLPLGEAAELLKGEGAAAANAADDADRDG